LAVTRPELVRGLLTIDGGPVESAATPGMKHAFKLGGFAAKLALDESTLRHDVRREIIRNSGDTSWVTDAVIREYTAPQAADLDGAIDAFHQMSKAKEADSLADRLSRYHGPVRLLVGTVRHPAEVSEAQQALLRDRLPNFRIESVPGSGQYINEEQPAVVVAAVEGLDRASQ
jgi:pimeloyl-ACP methyl ester carboxylesterase